MKKFLASVLALTMVSGVAISATSCAKVVVDLDKTKTQLYVANYNGGTGWKWLDTAVERFEAEYAETSFEEDKKGVQVIVDHSKAYTGTQTLTNLPTSRYEVFFAGAFSYFDAASGGMLLDISDLVTETVNAQDGKTIYSKLPETSKEALKVGGKYYGIPHTEAYDGVSYDAGVFKTKLLYFSDREDANPSKQDYRGTSEFITSENDTKSCGPDGVFGNYDDGLPSSYQEFYKLIDRMYVEGVTPFVFAGGNDHYTNKLPIALFENYIGAEGMTVNFDYDSGEEKIEIVTGWQGDKPVPTEETLDHSDAYKIRSSLGLYYAIEFAQKIFSDNKYYDKDMANSTSSHLDAMEKFMKSGLDGENYVGMLIDGNYWYNEADADGIFENVKKTYPDTYTQKDVRFMPLPHQYEGRVTEGNGKAPTLTDTYSYYAFINANTPENHQEVAKLFLSFVYGDEELQKATEMSNGVSRGVIYDLTSVKANSNAFAKSIFEMREAAEAAGSLLTAISNDPIFVYNQMNFRVGSTSDYFRSCGYANVYKAFTASNPPTAKEYFEGLAMSESKWNTDYNKNYGA